MYRSEAAGSFYKTGSLTYVYRSFGQPNEKAGLNPADDRVNIRKIGFKTRIQELDRIYWTCREDAFSLGSMPPSAFYLCFS